MNNLEYVRLTCEQEEYFNSFMRRVKKKSICFRDAERLAWGKTTIINELGLHLQALGYNVGLISPVNCIEYYACKRIFDIDDLIKIKRDNTVVLIDEQLRDSELLLEVENFCDDYDIPMVGFVKY